MKTRKLGQCFLQPAPHPSPFLLLHPLRQYHHHPSPLLKTHAPLHPRKPTPRSLTTTTSLQSSDSSSQDETPTSTLSQDLPPPPSAPAPDPQKAEEISRIISETWALKKAPQNSATDFAAARHAKSIRTTEAELRANREGSIAGSMKFPGKPSSSTTSSFDDPSRAVISNLHAINEASVTLVPRATRTVKSRPIIGRTVEVGPQGVARALQILGRECRDNNVRGDQIRDRFHERKGMKLKRLKRERWRRRFGEGFRATVRLVKEMRRKGW